MIREIVKDQEFLQQPSTAATTEDRESGQDLLDTLIAHKDHCAGLAANMIGVSKTILAVVFRNRFVLMYNPVITGHSAASFEAREGCLSLPGEQPVKRYEQIEVEYFDADFRKKRRVFTGLTAQAVQHEMDHFTGKLI